MSVGDKLNRIIKAKTDISNALTVKGQNPSNVTFEEYYQLILDIVSGGDGVLSQEEYDYALCLADSIIYSTDCTPIEGGKIVDLTKITNLNDEGLSYYLKLKNTDTTTTVDNLLECTDNGIMIKTVNSDDRIIYDAYMYLPITDDYIGGKLIITFINNSEWHTKIYSDGSGSTRTYSGLWRHIDSLESDWVTSPSLNKGHVTYEMRIVEQMIEDGKLRIINIGGYYNYMYYGNEIFLQKIEIYKAE